MRCVWRSSDQDVVEFVESKGVNLARAREPKRRRAHLLSGTEPWGPNQKCKDAQHMACDLEERGWDVRKVWANKIRRKRNKRGISSASGVG